MAKYQAVFNGVDDYSLWRQRIQSKLMSKKLWRKVNVNPRPESKSYNECQDQAKAYIIESIDNTVLRNLDTKNLSVRELFEYMGKSYIKKGIEEQIMFRKQLESLKFSLGDDLNKHLVDFDILCGKFDDAALTASEKMSEPLKVQQLLMSMPEGKLEEILGPSDPREYQLAVSRIRAKHRFMELKGQCSKTRHVQPAEDDRPPAVLFTNRKNHNFKNRPSKSYSSTVSRPTTNNVRRCYSCNSTEHMQRDCRSSVEGNH